jgi:hypothetical protein
VQTRYLIAREVQEVVDALTVLMELVSLKNSRPLQ